MAVTYTAAMKNVRMDATMLLVANGTLEIGTTGMATVLATFGLDANGGVVTGAVWDLEPFDVNPVSAGDTGVAAEAQIKDSGTTVQISGLTVGTGSEDIVLDNTSINSGQDVELTAATITHAT